MSVKLKGMAKRSKRDVWFCQHSVSLECKACRRRKPAAAAPPAPAKPRRDGKQARRSKPEGDLGQFMLML